jgi:probable blue pigment (indigoidine) exporter
VLSNSTRLTAASAVAPMTWGTTYLIASQLLPEGRPLLAATVRALPAGLLLLAVTRRLPTGAWWWKSAILGTLNIGAFFALLFVAAYRLPGGVAATVGAIQPLIVTVLASRLVGEAVSRRNVIAGIAGVGGVAMLVLQSNARLDPLGVLAAAGAALLMASGNVLAKRWGQPERPLVMTSWQLVAGGIVLLPIMLLAEGLPSEPLSGRNVAGFAVLTLVGTALAYTLWFRGIGRLPVGRVAFLGLLSPVVAVTSGWLVLGQSLSPGQALGAVIVLGSVAAVTVLRPAVTSAVTSPVKSGGLQVDDLGRPGAVVGRGDRLVLDVRGQAVADFDRGVGEAERRRVDVPRPVRVDARVAAHHRPDRDRRHGLAVEQRLGVVDELVGRELDLELLLAGDAEGDDRRCSQRSGLVGCLVVGAGGDAEGREGEGAGERAVAEW